MSYGIIKGIYIKADGVFLDSRNSNDSIPFRVWRSDSLSEIYAN